MEEKKVNGLEKKKVRAEMIRCHMEGRGFGRTDCVNCTEDSGRSEKICVNNFGTGRTWLSTVNIASGRDCRR